MGNFYHFNTDRALVLFHSTGRFTEDDFIALLRAVYDDPRHKPHFNHVWDSRDIDELSINANVINLYRDTLDEYEDKITREKIAVLAVRTVTRTFTSMLMQVGAKHPATFRIFEDVDTAAEWLGVPVSSITDVPDSAWTKV